MSELADDREIRDLVATFCHLIDHGRGDEVPERCYTEDAVDDHGVGMFSGWEEMRAFFRRESLGSFLAATAHIIGNQLVKVEGDQAWSQSYVTIWNWLQSSSHLGDQRPADIVVVAIYDDTLVRTPDGWRITARYCRRIGPSIVASAELAKSDLSPLIDGVQTRLGPEHGHQMVV